MKLELVGELPNHNPYEIACELAQDVDLSRGTIRPRLDDVQIATGDIKRVQVADGGRVRYSSTTGYGFSWGEDVYWINGDNSWQKVDRDGTVTNLTAPPAPGIGPGWHFASYNYRYHGTNGNWDVAPTTSDTEYYEWSGLAAGTVGRTWTYTTPIAITWAKYISFCVSVPADAVATIECQVNGTDQTVAVVQDDVAGYWWVQVSLAGITSLSSIAMTYRTTSNTHTVRISKIMHFLGSVPAGKHVYLASIVRGGVESAPSSVYPVTFSAFRHSALGVGQVTVRVSGMQNGDVVKLYRSVDGTYVKVAEKTATTTWIDMIDGGDVGETFRPCGVLPYGPAVVVGNRVAVASDRVVYISQAGEPTRFATVAINNDNQDAFSVVLPESIVALSHHELGVVAHTRVHQHLIRLQPQFDNDLVHLAPPARIEAPTARSHRAVWGQILVDSDGNVWIDGSRVFGGLSGDVHVAETDGRIYIAVGTKIYAHKPLFKGWVEYTLPATVNWMTTDGQDVYVATSAGLYKLEGGTTRKASCTWRTGKLFGDRLSAVRYIHIAGQADTVKLIRPTLPDKTWANVSGRLHTEVSQQTYEMQLEFATSSEIFQVHLSAEGGIK